MKRKHIKILLSSVLILISYGFIAYKIIRFKELKEITFPIHSLTTINLGLILTTVLLMIVNWSIESIKWKILINKINCFSFFDSFKAVFAGITIGIFTPNRVGEIGGRVLFLAKGKRTFGVLATAMGSFAQFITTIATGILGFILFLFLFPDKINLSPIFNRLSAIALIVFLIFIIWSYFNLKRIKPLLLKISFLKSKQNQLEYFSEINNKRLFAILLLSFLRYLVFSAQFYILLFAFQINLNLLQAFISISLIYLFATLIPTTTLAELGIRGSLAVLFIGLFSDQMIGIIFSTILLWFINLAIPAFIGSIFLLKKNFE